MSQLLKVEDVGVRHDQFAAVGLGVNAHPAENGSKFISKVLDHWADDQHGPLNFVRPGKPTHKPSAESSNGRLLDE